MAIVSAKLVDGETAVYSTFNNLREDLLANHVHDGTAGAKIDHKDLTESDVMSGFYVMHADLDVHVGGSSHTVSDDPGYNRGVHGLNSAVYVAGSGGAQLVVATGTGTLDGSGDATISFGVTFSAAPRVFIQPAEDHSVSPYGDDLGVFTLIPVSVTKTGCAVRQSSIGARETEVWANQDFYWLAIGTVAK